MVDWDTWIMRLVLYLVSGRRESKSGKRTIFLPSTNNDPCDP